MSIPLLSLSKEIVSVPTETGGISVSAEADVNFENTTRQAILHLSFRFHRKVTELSQRSALGWLRLFSLESFIKKTELL